MDEYLAHFRVLENALADCEHLLLHFRGPVCDLSVRPVTALTARLRDLLAGQGVPLPPAIRAASDPYALLRFILAACPGLAARAEAEICRQEILAAAAARPSPGIRTLLDGPASVSIIGDVCPAAIKGYLARLYRHHLDRVRLIIGRLGADPALLEPTPIPILQAAQLLGVPPAACAVVASTPDSIRAARQAGAPAIGYARTAAAAGDQLTAAGAAASTDSMTELAGAAYSNEQRRQYDLRHPGAPSLRAAATGAWGARSRESATSDEKP
jgi:beta-phosphoglucomutase-like phosphatase (HAD superfamily)